MRSDRRRGRGCPRVSTSVLTQQRPGPQPDAKKGPGAPDPFLAIAEALEASFEFVLEGHDLAAWLVLGLAATITVAVTISVAIAIAPVAVTVATILAVVAAVALVATTVASGAVVRWSAVARVSSAA